MGERPPAGPDASTLYFKPLPVVTKPRLSGTFGGGGTRVSEDDDVSFGSGVVLQPVTVMSGSRTAMRRRRSDFMEDGGLRVRVGVDVEQIAAESNAVVRPATESLAQGL